MSGLLSYAASASGAIVQLGLLVVLGFILGVFPRPHGLLSEPSLSEISAQVYFLYTPALLVATFGASLTVSILGDCSGVMMWSIIHLVVNFAGGAVAARLFPVERHFRASFILAATFVNGGNVPLLLMAGITATAPQFENDPGAYGRAVIAVWLYLLPWNLAFYSFGLVFMQRDAAALRRAAGEDDDVEAAPQLSRLQFAVQTARKVLLTPPMVGIGVGVVIGLIEPLRTAFFVRGGLLQSIGDITAMLGTPCVPLSNLVLAGSLYHGVHRLLLRRKAAAAGLLVGDVVLEHAAKAAALQQRAPDQPSSAAAVGPSPSASNLLNDNGAASEALQPASGPATPTAVDAWAHGGRVQPSVRQSELAVAAGGHGGRGVQAPLAPYSGARAASAVSPAGTETVGGGRGKAAASGPVSPPQSPQVGPRAIRSGSSFAASATTAASSAGNQAPVVTATLSMLSDGTWVLSAAPSAMPGTAAAVTDGVADGAGTLNTNGETRVRSRTGSSAVDAAAVMRARSRRGSSDVSARDGVAVVREVLSRQAADAISAAVWGTPARVAAPAATAASAALTAAEVVARTRATSLASLHNEYPFMAVDPSMHDEGGLRRTRSIVLERDRAAALRAAVAAEAAAEAAGQAVGAPLDRSAAVSRPTLDVAAGAASARTSSRPTSARSSFSDPDRQQSSGRAPVGVAPDAGQRRLRHDNVSRLPTILSADALSSMAGAVGVDDDDEDADDYDGVAGADVEGGIDDICDTRPSRDGSTAAHAKTAASAAEATEGAPSAAAVARGISGRLGPSSAATKGVDHESRREQRSPRSALVSASASSAAARADDVDANSIAPRETTDIDAGSGDMGDGDGGVRTLPLSWAAEGVDPPPGPNSVSLRTVGVLMLVRLLLCPALLFGLFLAAETLRIPVLAPVGQDPVLRLLVLLETLAPSAQSVLLLCQMTNQARAASDLSLAYLAMYPVSLVTMTAGLMIAMGIVFSA